MSTRRISCLPALVVLSSAILLSSVNAAELTSASFDANVQPLPALSDATIQERAKALLNEDTSTPEHMVALLRDKARFRRWKDFGFQVGRAMDERGSLANSEQYGLIRQPDGRYNCDLKNFPQLVTLDQRMQVALMPSGLEYVREQLRQRGFREADLAKFAEYVSSHHPQREALDRNVLLVKSFSARLQQRKRFAIAERNKEIESFIYQRRSNEWQQSRTWAVGLLDLLDAQRQRILVSFILEQRFARSIRPDDRLTVYAVTAERLMNGQYVRDLEQQQETTQ